VSICFILANLNVGGQERLTIWLAEYFRSLGHEVCIVCLSGKGALLTECRERSIEVTIPAAPYRASFLQLDLLRWLRRFFRERRPDVVHSHAFEANYYARIAGLGLPGAFFAHEHNIYPDKRTVHFAIDSLLSRKSDRVICISHAVAEFHIRHEMLDRSKVSVIWNGVPLERGKVMRSRREVREELGIADATPVLIATGSFKPQKGHTVLIDALARMKNRDCILVLAGSGPLEAECRALVASRRLTERVRFAGAVDHIADYLEAADVFVLSSLWEGFGIAVVEAALSRRPIVATAVDGVVEIVRDMESAFLSMPGDAAALATKLDFALNRMASEPAMVHAMCETAYQRAREIFSLERMAGQILELYQEVLAGQVSAK